MSRDFQSYAAEALGTMGGDPEKAAELMMAWAERDSAIRDSFKPAIEAAMREAMAVAMKTNKEVP